MKTLNLYHAKQDRYENEELEYRTWFWNDDERCNSYGWCKRPVPNFRPSEEKLAEEWFNISNREDLIFLEKEKMACQYWYDAQKKEIYRHNH